MEYEGYLFKSTNKGTTWTQTSFAPVTGEDPNEVSEFDGQKMAIDPNNPNIVVCRNAAEWSVYYDEWRSQLAKRERCAGGHGNNE